jgi:hypothetical protein
VSRNASEPETASLNKVEAASPPERMKPDIYEEAIGRSTHGASRGERGQHAGTDQTGTWETRRVGDGDIRDSLQEHITEQAWPGRESERPIVAGKSSNVDGAKGPY